MHTDKYKTKNGEYDAKGILYASAEDFIQSGVLGMCGCGDVDANLVFVKNALQHLKNLSLVHDKNKTYDRWAVEGLALFGSTSVESFVYYVLAETGLTEHGLCIPGWLTAEGENFLEDLIEMYPES
jgi:hypothetical protein